MTKTKTNATIRLVHDSFDESSTTTWSSTMNLSSSVDTIWIGEDISEIDFQLVLPEKLGFVICADLFLTCTNCSKPTDNFENDVQHNEKQVIYPFMLQKFAYNPNHDGTATGKEIPIVDFDSSIVVCKDDLERQSFQLASILNESCEKQAFAIKAKLHMKSFPDHVDSVRCSLHFTTNDKFLSMVKSEQQGLLDSFNDDDEDESVTGGNSGGLCTFKAQSCAIQIANLKLCIQTLTESSSITLADAAGGGGGGDTNNKPSGNTIEWYSKQGGDNTCIDVMFHLKDRKGSIVHNHPDIPLFTELVYEDGSPLVLMPPVGGKKQRRSSLSSSLTQGQEQAESSTNETTKKKNQIYRPMRPEPILCNGNGSVHYAFRIEDVSANHKPHVGFKLKVSAALGAQIATADGNMRIYGGLMDETIVVKSRPFIKSSPMHQDRSIGGRTTILQKVLGGIPILGNLSTILRRSNSKTKKIPASGETITPPPPPAQPVDAAAKTSQTLLSTTGKSKYIQVDSDTQKVSFDMECINSFFCGTGNACLSCGEELKMGECLSPAEHKLDCRLFLTLSPLLIHAITDFGNDSILSSNTENMTSRV